MPRPGVPSTTPIPPASSLTSAANRPPCRGRQIPGTTIDPPALFRASFNPLIETWEKGRKEGAWSPPPGRKPRVQAAAQRRRFDVPRPISKRASSAFMPTLTPAGYARQAIDFSKLPSRTGGRTNAPGLRRFGRDRGQVQEKARMSGLGSAEAAGVEAPPYGGTFMGIARTALSIGPRGPQRPCPAQSRSRGAQVIPRKLTVLPRIGAS